MFIEKPDISSHMGPMNIETPYINYHIGLYQGWRRD